MTLEELQMIVITPMEFVFKVSWLRWWNSSNMFCEFMCIVLGDIKENELKY